VQRERKALLDQLDQQDLRVQQVLQDHRDQVVELKVLLAQQVLLALQEVQVLLVQRVPQVQLDHKVLLVQQDLPAPKAMQVLQERRVQRDQLDQMEQ
jgi:hypothetical protein